MPRRYFPIDESEGGRQAGGKTCCDDCNRQAGPTTELGILGRSEVVELAERRGWPRIPEEELRRASREAPGRITQVLGERIVVVAGGAAFRVRLEEPTQPFTTRAPRDENVLPRYQMARNPEQEVVPYDLQNPDDRTALLPTVLSRNMFGIPKWNLSTSPYAPIVRYLTGSTIAQGFAGPCSGAFISPYHILTAGHCVDAWTFLNFPAALVQASASGLVALYNYTGPLAAVFYYGNGIGEDIALLALPALANPSPYWFGLETMSHSKVGEGVRIYGYPNSTDFCWTSSTNPQLPPGTLRPNYPRCGMPPINTQIFRHLYYDTCQISDYLEFANLIMTPCDSTDGMSGGPMVRTKTGTERIIAVNKGSGKLTPTGPFEFSLCAVIAATMPPLTGALASYVCGEPRPGLD